MVCFHFSCASWKRLAVRLCKVDLGDDDYINATVLLNFDMRVAFKAIFSASSNFSFWICTYTTWRFSHIWTNMINFG